MQQVVAAPRQVADPADGLVQFVNKERITSEGLELDARLRAGRRFSGHAGYTLQNTREKGGGRLSNSPEHTGTVGVTGELAEKEASAGLELFLIGRRTTYQNPRLPAAALL